MRGLNESRRHMMKLLHSFIIITVIIYLCTVFTSGDDVDKVPIRQTLCDNYLYSGELEQFIAYKE